jgi:hypothetical protein
MVLNTLLWDWEKNVCYYKKLQEKLKNICHYEHTFGSGIQVNPLKHLYETIIYCKFVVQFLKKFHYVA